MRKENILEISYKIIQRSGKVNMVLGRNDVQWWANEYGLAHLVCFLQDIDTALYMAFLKCNDYSNVAAIDDVDIEYLEEASYFDAATEIHELFPEAFENEKTLPSFETFLEIPFSKQTFEDSGMTIFEFLLANVEEHPMHYLFVAGRNTDGIVVKFDDSEHQYITKQGTGEMKELDGETWKYISVKQERFRDDVLKKFKIIDEECRLMALMA